MPMNAKHAKQLSEAPRGNSSARAAPDDQARYLKGKSRQREQALRQFMKGENTGTRGNSQAFMDGWDRIFGDKKAVD